MGRGLEKLDLPIAEIMAEGVTFVLSQVGTHGSTRFAQRLESLQLKLPHAGILKAIGQSDGLSQQALCERIGVFSSRLVGLLDELEKRGLVERRNNPADRRSYAVHLTAAGRKTLQQIHKIGEQHEQALCAALSESERKQLAELLARIAAEQGLTPGIHPGLKQLKDSE